MTKFGKELIDSMKQAAAHAGGRKVPGMRVTTVEIPDVRLSANPCTCRSIDLRRCTVSRLRH
jgi:hypothetical protein